MRLVGYCLVVYEHFLWDLRRLSLITVRVYVYYTATSQCYNAVSIKQLKSINQNVQLQSTVGNQSFIFYRHD